MGRMVVSNYVFGAAVEPALEAANYKGLCVKLNSEPPAALCGGAPTDKEEYNASIHWRCDADYALMAQAVVDRGQFVPAEEPEIVAAPASLGM